MPPLNPTPPSPPADIVGVNYGDLEFGDGTYARLESRAKFKPQDPDDQPAIAAPRRPVWHLKLYWDGDASPPLDYSDFTHGDLPAGTEFRVLDWGQIVQTAKGVATFDRFRVVLSNLIDATTGLKLSDEFSLTNPPEGIKLEIDVKVIQPETGPIAGFVTVFTGRIEEVPVSSELEVELIATSEDKFVDRNLLPTIKTTDFPRAPSSSFDKPQPAVFGEVFNHECVAVEVNQKATLASSLISTATSVQIEEDPGFAASGTVRIDNEKMSYASITPGLPATLIGIVRGTGGTTATDHPAGVEVIEDGQVTYLVAAHAMASGGITNPRLVDSAGNIRQIPDDITVALFPAAEPARIELSEQPVLTSLSSQAGSVFKFVDLDTADLLQSEISGAVPTQEVVEQILGRSSTFVDVAFATIANGGFLDRLTGYRAAPITGIPEGAVLKKAYAVVEGFNDGPTESAETDIDAQLLSSQGVPFTLNVDSTTGFINPPSLAKFFIGEEQFAYDSVTATSFNVTARALNAAAGPALTHPAASVVRQGTATCFVRNPLAGASTTISGADAEGDFHTTTDTPEEIDQSTGLIAVSKGFEDDHTHVVPGDHNHSTTTAHTHESSDVLDWIPDIVEARAYREPITGCPSSMDWEAPVVRLDLGNSADGQAGTSAPWTSLSDGGVFDGAGHFYIRGSAAAASPNDARVVTGIEVSILTSRASQPAAPSGSGQASWEWVDLGMGCQANQVINQFTVGDFRLDIGTNLSTAFWPFTQGTPGVSQIGNKLSRNLSITRSPNTYDANPNTIYTDVFSLDVTAESLTVADFVDSDYGGQTSGQHIWIHFQDGGLAIHAVRMRLDVETATSTESIGTPIDVEDNPDTDSEAPLKRSVLSWFDLGPKVTSASQLINLRFQVRNANAVEFPDPFLCLRIFFALEFETVTVSGDSESPSRLICDAQGLAYPANKGHWFIRSLLADANLMNLPASILDVSNFSALSPKVALNGGGVQRNQILASQAIQDISTASQLLPVWNGDGVLTLTYLEARADIQSGIAPQVLFTDNDLQPTEGGASRPRAPLDQILNEYTVRAKPNSVSGGFDITSTGEDTNSKALYGITKAEEEETLWHQFQAGADRLQVHRLDYNALTPVRVTFRVHLTQKAINLTGPGAIIGLDLTPDFLSASLQVERRIIDLGVGRTGSVPYVEFQCVDRS